MCDWVHKFIYLRAQLVYIILAPRGERLICIPALPVHIQEHSMLSIFFFYLLTYDGYYPISKWEGGGLRHFQQHFTYRVYRGCQFNW